MRRCADGMTTGGDVGHAVKTRAARGPASMLCFFCCVVQGEIPTISNPAFRISAPRNGQCKLTRVHYSMAQTRLHGRR